MAKTTVRVVGHYADSSNKTILHLGTAQQHVISTTLIGSDGRLDPNDVNTILNGNSKFKGAASQFVVVGYQICDHDQMPAGILS